MLTHCFPCSCCCFCSGILRIRNKYTAQWSEIFINCWRQQSVKAACTHRQPHLSRHKKRGGRGRRVGLNQRTGRSSAFICEFHLSARTWEQWSEVKKVRERKEGEGIVENKECGSEKEHRQRARRALFEVAPTALSKPNRGPRCSLSWQILLSSYWHNRRALRKFCALSRPFHSPAIIQTKLS